MRRAITAIARLPATKLTGIAPWYQTRAVGPGRQPNYLNTVVAIATALSPLRLLKALQGIERQQGRRRIVRWGPRTIDLDILIYGTQTMYCKKLTIPHPRLTQRNFVILPLADIAPDLVLPDTTPLWQLLANCSTAGIVRVKAGETSGSTG